MLVLWTAGALALVWAGAPGPTTGAASLNSPRWEGHLRRPETTAWSANPGRALARFVAGVASEDRPQGPPPPPGPPFGATVEKIDFGETPKELSRRFKKAITLRPGMRLTKEAWARTAKEIRSVSDSYRFRVNLGQAGGVIVTIVHADRAAH